MENEKNIPVPSDEEIVKRAEEIIDTYKTALEERFLFECNGRIAHR